MEMPSNLSRKDLILKIISLYPDTFRADRQEHVQAWVEMYEKAIRKDWNMDKLMRYFATDYKSTVVPPPPSFFYAYREDVCQKKYERQEIPVLTQEERRQNTIAYEKFKEDCKKLLYKKSIERS